MADNFLSHLGSFSHLSRGLGAQGSILVAAIDFGTTYSGWAFSFKHEFESDPIKVSAKQWTGGNLVSLKGPTCVLIKDDGKTLHSFGFDAETKYAELAETGQHENWFFFKRFKMTLFGDVGTEIKPMLEDATGKELPALDVFSLAIRHLKEDLLKMSNSRLRDTSLEPDDISWVLTVPAIWNDAAKNFMREAANKNASVIHRLKLSNSRLRDTSLEPDDISWVLTVPAIWYDAAKNFMQEAANKAGISHKKLTIALEPEAASLYCRHLPVEKNGGESILSTFKSGTKYLVLDAGGGTGDLTIHQISDTGNIMELHKANGGGTVDITIHQVSDNGNITELHKASGGAWGGTRVDDAYKQFLIKLVGAPVMKKFMKNNMEDYIELLRDFEIKKRSVSPKKDGKITIRLPIALIDLFEKMTEETLKEVIPNSSYARKITFTGDKLRVDVDVLRIFFDESIRSILDHLKDLFQKSEVRGCSAIIMVGGFSESPMLQEAIKSTFCRLKIIVPEEAGLAVLKGAVIFGHRPTIIEARVSKYTYGTDIADTFNPNAHPESLKKTQDNGEVLCTGLFSPLVKVGQTMKVGKAQDEHSYRPTRDAQTAMPMDIYATTEANPKYITDPGCYKIASCTVPMPNTKGGKDRSVSVRMIFGGTEIRMECTDNTSGNVTNMKIDYQN